MLFPIILAGGTGTRLWPLSRKSYPKQFANIMNEKTLFQERALFRFTNNKMKFQNPIILTNDTYRFIVKEQLEEINIKAEKILIEPSAKNTAPAIIAAALYLEKKYPNSIMLVKPSDHLITSSKLFENCILKGMKLQEKGELVTFGILPTRPETAYGYLKTSHKNNKGPQKVLEFIEKPNRTSALKMINTGNYLWNSGIFLFSAKDIIKAYNIYSKDIIKNVRYSINDGKNDLNFFRLNKDAWLKCKNISIDKAIFEKAKNLSLVPFKGKWSDLGSWDTVWDEKKSEKNSLVKSKNVTAIDCKNSLLRSEDDRTRLVGLGVKDIFAIAMPDAVLIADKGRAQDVKKIVEKLKAEGVDQAESFPKEHRPWGWFEILIKGERFKVKRINVKIGGILSLQSHKYRSEHWVVVEGTAKVTIDNNVKIISEEESTFVPLGAIHRLENEGKIPLVLIEIQTGSYLGEDDIQRYEDLYSR